MGAPGQPGEGHAFVVCPTFVQSFECQENRLAGRSPVAKSGNMLWPEAACWRACPAARQLELNVS